MKAKVNIRDFIEENADHNDMLLVHASVDVDDLFDTNCIPEEHEFDLDIHELLAEHRQIALIWDTDMLLSHYGHLTVDQAWEVLQECERHYTAENGLTWDDISEVVHERYPEPEQRWRGRIDVTITDTDGYSEGEALTRFRDMAELLGKDMPDVKADVDPGSVRFLATDETSSK